MTAAFAAMDLPLGTGTIDGTVNKVAKVSTEMLASQFSINDITCTLSDPTADRMPVKVKVEAVAGDATSFNGVHTVGTVYFDDQKDMMGQPIVSETHQQQLSDTKTHTFVIKRVNDFYKGAVVLTWLAGDDVATPVNYSCSATPSVGK
jgi:hypothetical protein